MMSLSQLLLISVILVLSVCSINAEDAFQGFGLYTDAQCSSGNKFNATDSLIGGVNSWENMGRLSTNDARTATTNTAGAPCVSSGAVDIARGQYECRTERDGTTGNVVTRVLANEWYNSTTCGGTADQTISGETLNSTSSTCFVASYSRPGQTAVPVYMKVVCGGANSATSASLSIIAIAVLAVVASMIA